MVGASAAAHAPADGHTLFFATAAALVSNPHTFKFATDGPRNFSGILTTWLNKVSGADIVQVPYAAMPQGVQDTVAVAP